MRGMCDSNGWGQWMVCLFGNNSGAGKQFLDISEHRNIIVSVADIVLNGIRVFTLNHGGPGETTKDLHINFSSLLCHPC